MEKLIRRKSKAESEGNKTLLTSVCIDLAELHLQSGNYYQAIDEYKTVATIYMEQKKKLEYACAHRMIGEAYSHLLLYDNALKHEEVYLKVAQEENNKMEQQRALATIGHIYLTMSLSSEEPNPRKLELASRNFLKSLDICEKLAGVIAKREQMDMAARLFANLGVVHEAQGKFNQGIELVTRSINICKKYDIFEQLERCYTTLSSLYLKSGDFSSAIANLNLAMETAGRLPQKVSLTCSSLLSKADIHMRMNDVQSAQGVLLKAYKLKTPNANDSATIEKNLRIVAAMNYAEVNLLVASLTDHATRKSLYERLGDGACYFKNYSTAINYYKMMLDSALKNNESGKALSPCYVSLAQTYLDDKQFDKAIEYYSLDLEISKESLTDSINTIFNITAAMDQAGKSVDEVCTVFKQAVERCKQAESDKELARVLERHILYLKKHSKLTDAAKLEVEFQKLDCNLSESESDAGDCADSFALGDDIDIDNITDLSSSEDEKDLTVRASRKRNKPKGFTIKRNAKGETQLHVATIDGNVQLVEKLLGQGHVVNIRDNAGWLPIHEACICGHLDIVKMLVDKGAAINDRGGVKCEGMTPLHDAASNGHLDIIEYMLSKGASPLAKTDSGETPLSFLKLWRASVTLDPNEQVEYNRIVESISNVLMKAGQKEHDSALNKSNEALVYVEHDNSIFNMTTSSKRLNYSHSSSNSGGETKDVPSKASFSTDLRRNPNAGDDDSPRQSHLTSDYKNTMDLFRKTPVSGVSKKRKPAQQSALLTPDEVDIDDWLEDDVSTVSKKKRRANSTLSLRRENSSHSISSDEDMRSDDCNSIDLGNVEPNAIHSIGGVGSVGATVKSAFKKRKSQQTLLKSGFTRVRDSPSPVESFCSNDSRGLEKSTTCRLQTKLSNFVARGDDANCAASKRDLRTNECDMNTTQMLIKNQMLYIDVRIEEKLFRIPFPAKDLESLTISWLAEETTKRFYKKEAMKPIIEVETKTGAILCDDDVLSVLFPIGVTHCEELQAKVVKWNVPPLKERYLDACQYFHMEPSSDISSLLDATTVNLDLSDKKYRERAIPIARALNRQTSLYELNLSGLLAGNKMLEALCESLPTLANLTILNLSANHITADGLNALASTFKFTPHKSLTSFDLSFNPLGNECLKHLSDLTHNLKLEKLNLCGVDFTLGLFNNSYNQHLTLDLRSLQELIISHNELGKADLARILMFLYGDKVQLLDIGNNSVEIDGLGVDLLNMLRRKCEERHTGTVVVALKKCYLSRCMMRDDDVMNMQAGLTQDGHEYVELEDLDLSYNEFSGVSLKQILVNTSPKSLSIMGCDNLNEAAERVFDADWKFASTSRCKYLETTLDYVQDFRQCDTLINMFRDVYIDQLDIQGLDEGMLTLSVRN